jgi:hypothetical protein
MADQNDRVVGRSNSYALEHNPRGLLMFYGLKTNEQTNAPRREVASLEHHQAEQRANHFIRSGRSLA